MIILIILAFVLVAIIQIPSLVKKKYWRELIAFCVFFLFSFVICILQAAGVKLPSPAKGLQSILDKINLHF